MSEKSAPAETYTINVLASSLGRFAVKDISKATADQAGQLLEETLSVLLSKKVPKVPHTEPELLRQAILFDQKMMKQLQNGPVAYMANTALVNYAIRAITEHDEYCNMLLAGNAKSELLVSPNTIANSYELPDLWERASELVENEIIHWGESRQHPGIPELLQQQVSKEKTESLMQFVWQDVLGIAHMPPVAMHMVDSDSNYHVFWSPTAEGFDYATPASYDLATQLSFDIPHNAAHLAHLAALDTSRGALTYNDNMAQRAYFEAVAVLSEFVITELAANHEDFGDNLAEAIGADDDSGLISELLRQWIIDDRSYEFKLRAARLYSDILMLEGASFSEAVQEISYKFNIPTDHASAEVKKYLPWTGLGGIYTHGYRKLLNKNITSVPSAIFARNGDVANRWSHVPKM